MRSIALENESAQTKRAAIAVAFLDQLARPCVARTPSRGDEQAEDGGRHRRDQSNASFTMSFESVLTWSSGRSLRTTIPSSAPPKTPAKTIMPITMALIAACLDPPLSPRGGRIARPVRIIIGIVLALLVHGVGTTR